MTNPTLTFKIVGADKDQGLVMYDDFVAFCQAVQRCLRCSAQIAADEPNHIAYRITNMSCASACVSLQARRRGGASPEDPKRTVAFFRRAVAGIQRGEIDPRIGPHDLETFKELATPLKRAKGVAIGRVQITEKFPRAIEKLMASWSRSQGSVAGSLDRINVHNKHEIVLYPSLPGSRVTCTFPENLLGEVQAAIKRRVTVQGTLHWKPGDAYPYKVQATSITLHPRDEDLPTFADLKALGPWDTQGVTAAEFVRALRDEQD